MTRRLYAFLAVLFAALLAGCGPAAPAATPSAPATYVETVAIARASGYEAPSSYTGRVEAALTSAVGFEVGGLLTDVMVDDGDRIERGQPLAILDTARLGASRAEAAAALAQVEADLELARATFARTSEAFDYKGVSQQQLDEARQRVHALEAAKQVAAARIQRIDVDIDKARLVAPFDGTAIRRVADPGVVLAAGQPIIEIQSSADPEVRIGVAPDVVSSLAVGQQYDLRINDRPGRATLRAVVGRRDEVTRTVDALFVIDGADTQVRPGDIASFETRIWIDAPGFWLPMSALVEGPRGLWQALVAEPDGNRHVLVGRTLEVLHAGAERVYVRGTLTEGDRLVGAGTQRVVVGQVVRIDTPAGPERVARAGGDHAAD